LRPRKIEQEKSIGVDSIHPGEKEKRKMLPMGTKPDKRITSHIMEGTI
jgi:hypothetical protein